MQTIMSILTYDIISLDSWEIWYSANFEFVKTNPLKLQTSYKGNDLIRFEGILLATLIYSCALDKFSKSIKFYVQPSNNILQ